MVDEILVSIFASQWRVIGLVSLILVCMAWLGSRLGHRDRSGGDESYRGHAATVQAAVLALLGLLLGFTFSMALERYDRRRSLVLQEANSIGTTFLRASFLPGSHKDVVEDLLRRYVELRIPMYSFGTDASELSAIEQQSAAVHRELWSHAVAATAEAPSPIMATFVTSLNQTIDLDASRLQALRAHVPGAAWLLVLLVASVGCYIGGYNAGTSGVRSTFATMLLPILLAIVITLIADLDRPRRGLIGVSNQPLLDLRKSIQK